MLQALFVDAQATVGAFLLEQLQATEHAIAALAMSPVQRAELHLAIERHIPEGLTTTLVVRSSAVGEDGASNAYAGIYRSTLGLRGLDEVVAAVEGCWRSYYQPPAILARIRTGDLNWAPRMAVIIQRQVPAELAGVGLSHGVDGQGPLIEYQEGLADGVLAGTVLPRTLTASDAPPPKHAEALRQVRTALNRLATVRREPVEMEWAWNGTAFLLLQVRPVTASHRPSGPHFAHAPLYAPGRLPSGITLLSCTPVWQSYTTKRGKLTALRTVWEYVPGRDGCSR